MILSLQIKRPIHPLIGLVCSLAIMVVGLVFAKHPYDPCFLLGAFLLYVLFGYYKSCIAILPMAGIMCLILAGITWLVSEDSVQTIAAANRIFALCLCVIPGLALPPITLVRGFQTLGIPRILTLAMMITLNFFPLLHIEIRRVREAMKTRGAGSLLSPEVFYRAFLIPLIVRLVGISDTLSLSVETRGFRTHGAYSVYRKVGISPRDVLFGVLVLVGIIGMVTVCMQSNLTM